METVSKASVVCRLGERDTLLQDTWEAVEASIPHDRLKDVLASLATTTSGQIMVRRLRWTFASSGRDLEVTIKDDTERFEVFLLEPNTWKAPPEEILPMIFRGVSRRRRRGYAGGP